MNPLGSGNFNNGLPPEIMQNIQQVKGMMNMFKGNPQAFMQQNPMLKQAMQMCQGQNPETVFRSMCKAKGVDPDAFINALKN